LPSYSSSLVCSQSKMSWYSSRPRRSTDAGGPGAAGQRA
jgi:hypothetical protein